MLQTVPSSEETYKTSLDSRLRFSRFLLQLFEKSRGQRIGEGDRVLDVGCGSHEAVSRLWNNEYNPGYVLGVDRKAYEVLEREDWAEEGAGKAREFAQRDVLEWEVPEEDFDIVFSGFSLHWLRNEQRFYEKMWRALKPGGHLVAHLPGRKNFLPLFHKILLRARQELENELDTNLFSEKAYWEHRENTMHFYKRMKQLQEVPRKMGFKKQQLLKGVSWETWNRKEIVKTWESAGREVLSGLVEPSIASRLIDKMHQVERSDEMMREIGIPLYSTAEGDARPDEGTEYVTALTHVYYMVLEKPPARGSEEKTSQSFKTTLNPDLPLRSLNEVGKQESNSKANGKEPHPWLPEQGDAEKEQAADERLKGTSVYPMLPLARELGDGFINGSLVTKHKEAHARFELPTLYNEDNQYRTSEKWRKMLIRSAAEVRTFTYAMQREKEEGRAIPSISLSLDDEENIIKDIVESSKWEEKEDRIAQLWIVGKEVRGESEEPKDTNPGWKDDGEELSEQEKDDYNLFLEKLDYGATWQLLYADNRLEKLMRLWFFEEEDPDPCGRKFLRHLRWQASIHYPLLFVLSGTNAQRQSTKVAHSASVTINPDALRKTSDFRLKRSDVDLIAACLKSFSIWRERDVSKNEGRAGALHSIPSSFATAIGKLIEHERKCVDFEVPRSLYFAAVESAMASRELKEEKFFKYVPRIDDFEERLQANGLTEALIHDIKGVAIKLAEDRLQRDERPIFTKIDPKLTVYKKLGADFFRGRPEKGVDSNDESIDTSIKSALLIFVLILLLKEAIEHTERCRRDGLLGNGREEIKVSMDEQKATITIENPCQKGIDVSSMLENSNQQQTLERVESLLENWEFEGPIVNGSWKRLLIKHTSEQPDE